MLALLVFLTLLAEHSAEAHIGERVYPIPEITDAMLEQIDLHDGTVAEWEQMVMAWGSFG